MTFQRFVFRSLTLFLFVALSVTPSRGIADSYGEYHEQDHTWIVGNRQVQAAFQLTGDGRFRFRWILDPVNNRSWHGSNGNFSSPINVTVDAVSLNEDTHYSLESYSIDAITSPAPGTRFSVVLSPPAVSAEIRFEADVYTSQPFVRY